MPYIKPELRKKYAQIYCDLFNLEIENKGELEYLIFSLMKAYMNNKEYRYSTLHDCVYGVQHCADEFRRRYLDKRENKAREENGDV